MRIALGATATTTPGGSDCWAIDALLGICTPPLPAAAVAPQLTPVAPETQYGMVNWSPDWLSEGTAQAGQQYSKDKSAAATAVQAAGGDGSGGTPAATPPTPSGLSTSTWVLLGIAGVLGIILTVKK